MLKLGMLIVFILGVNDAAWAYGSSSSSKSCAKPVFSAFTPADKEVVAQQAEFSFMVAPTNNPKSIIVTVKQQPVEVQTIAKNTGFQVIGKLPANLEPGMARINVSAEAANNCKGSDGWLLNISK